MGDLDDFGEGVDARRSNRLQLLLGHVAQRAHKLHDRLAVQKPTAQDIRTPSQAVCVRHPTQKQKCIIRVYTWCSLLRELMALS